MAGISHEAIPPKLDSIEPEAGGLLPCPFCGGEAKYRADHTTERVDTVSCFRCDFHISDDGDVGSCVAAWNRRASPAPVVAPAGYRLVPDAARHAKSLREVAAVLSTERIQGWANPLVTLLTDAAEAIAPQPLPANAGQWVLSASPAPVAVPAGWRLVPEEPTLAMRLTYDELNNELEISHFANLNLVWPKLLSASPVPSTATQAGAVTDELARCLRNMISLYEQLQGHPTAYSREGRAALVASGFTVPSVALASSPETARDRAERRVAELEAVGLHTLGDIERAQSSGEPIAFLSKRALAQFDVNGCEIVEARLYPRGTLRPNEEIAVFSRPQADDGWRPTGHVSIAHDGFAGDIIGHYETREGKRGVVVQQDGTRVVHVYGEKWLLPSAPATGGGDA